MKRLVALWVLCVVAGCGDMVGEVLEEAGAALQSRARAAREVPCVEEGGQFFAEFPARPGKTRVTVCYEGFPELTGGPLAEPHCWHGFAWYNPSNPRRGWIFCAEDTISVTVRY